MATFNTANKISVRNPVANIDNNYGPYTGATLNDALSLAHTTVGVLREIGVTVGILFNGNITEYWYKSGKDNLSDLVLKQPNGAISSDLYTPYSVLVNNAITHSPESLGISTNSVLGRVLGNIQAIVIDNDLSSVSSNDDTLASAKAIKAYVDGVVSSTFSYQGAYDAQTNTPNLDNNVVSPASGILSGQLWTVNVPGAFFTKSVQIGDQIIANKDNPLLLTDFTVVPATASAASETVTGIIRIATQSEVNAGVSGVLAVTPLTLKTFLGITSDKSIPRKTSFLINPTGLTDVVSYTITHGLGTQDVLVSIRDTESPYQEVETQIAIDTINRVVIDFTIVPPQNKYKVTIIG